MRYEIIFSATARRDLRKIPPRIVSAIIEFIYGDLARNPQRVGKPLERELEGFHSARRGPYRIIYSINNEHVTIELLRIDHRANVYRTR